MRLEPVVWPLLSKEDMEGNRYSQVDSRLVKIKHAIGHTSSGKVLCLQSAVSVSRIL